MRTPSPKRVATGDSPLADAAQAPASATATAPATASAPATAAAAATASMLQGSVAAAAAAVAQAATFVHPDVKQCVPSTLTLSPDSGASVEAQPWLTLAELEFPHSPLAFWHAAVSFTFTSILSSVWRVDVDAAGSAHDPRAAGDAEASSLMPAAHERRLYWRTVHRKNATQVTLRGETAGELRGRVAEFIDAREWLTHEVLESPSAESFVDELRAQRARLGEAAPDGMTGSEADDVRAGLVAALDAIGKLHAEFPSRKQKERRVVRRHVFTFALVVPECVLGEDNPVGSGFWPLHYVRCRCARIQLCEFERDDAEGAPAAVLQFAIVPLGEPTQAKMRRIAETILFAARGPLIMLERIAKFSKSYSVELGASTYVKRVHHDHIVPEERFRRRARELKRKYGRYWVENWTEKTDARKFVYEESNIAAYLLELWAMEREASGSTAMQTFADMGCGNGFLVYLLMQEGHVGVGVDMRRRGIWDLYPQAVRDALRVAAIDPTNDVPVETDWLLGNHSDELTPWIPVLASRSPSARYWVLPCCFWDLDGHKINFSARCGRRSNDEGKYKAYLQYVHDIGVNLGFDVEWENLRLPSTKFVSMLGRRRLTRLLPLFKPGPKESAPADDVMAAARAASAERLSDDAWQRLRSVLQSRREWLIANAHLTGSAPPPVPQASFDPLDSASSSSSSSSTSTTTTAAAAAAASSASAPASSS